MDYYSEEEFYQDNGWPTERLDYCDYIFYIDNETEYGPDYDQFALVVNATYPYIRLTKKRGRCHFPCGLSDSPAPESTYAQKTEIERNIECPKIAWGIAAMFLANVRYDNNQKDWRIYIVPNLASWDRVFPDMCPNSTVINPKFLGDFSNCIAILWFKIIKTWQHVLILDGFFSQRHHLF